MNASFLAPLLLGTFPLVILALFMRYRPAVATLASVLISELLLPPLYALPISPSWLTKWTLPPFAAGIMAFIFAPRAFRKSRPFRGIEGLFAVGLIVNLMSNWTNRDPLQYGPLFIPGEGAKDLLGDMVRFFGDPWIMFFLGRVLFNTSRDLTTLCRMLVISVLLYSLPILFEIRMSPNLNHWVYGYQASGFDMTIRWGGYRPTVFFKDGLPLAAYILTCAAMAVAMGRARMRLMQLPMKGVCVYILFILVICKSTGAIGYALLMVPMISFMSPRTSTRLASVLAVLFLMYPILRFSGAINVKPIIDFFTGVSTDRAGSLLYRFKMEDILMEHTRERLWWGWGEWGRNLVYDPVTGLQVSIPDGYVILTTSTHGMIGFFSYFLPFALTILRAPKFIKRIRSRNDRLLLSALALNCAVILFDLIFNSAFFPFYMLLFGALYSLPSGIIAEEAADTEAASLPEAELSPPWRRYGDVYSR